MATKKKRIIFIFLSSLIGGLVSVFLFFYDLSLISPFCGARFSPISGRLILIAGNVFLISFVLCLFIFFGRIKFWLFRILSKVVTFFITVIIIGISLVTIVLSTKFQPIQKQECGSIEPIGGNSMMPGIHDGDSLWFSSTKYLLNLERGLIVVVSGNYFEDKTIVKRIIGLPGETVNYNISNVLINNNILDEPYILVEPIKQLPFQVINEQSKYKEILVPSDSYFVMGDNRNHSADSRTFGVVKRKDINLYREDRYSQIPTRNPEKLFFGIKEESVFGYFNLTISIFLLCSSIYILIYFIKNKK